MKYQLISFILFIGSLTFGQSNLQNALSNFIDDADLSHSSVGILVKDLDNGEIVLQKNRFIALPTASTAKLFSTSSALEILGPDYQCETKVFAEGIIDQNGQLNGNIWIQGGGDPTLGSKYFNAEEKRMDFISNWCDSIENAGIKNIAGRIIADGSNFGYYGAPDGWTWGDMGNYYGSGPSGIIIFDNQIDLYFNTSKYDKGKTELKKMFPEIPGLSYRNEVTSSTSPGDNAYVYGAPFSFDRFITGTLPMGKSNFLVKGSNPDPEKTLAILLTEELQARGIGITNEGLSYREIQNTVENDYNKFKLLFTHKGEKIIEVINLTNLNSINLFAEQLVCLVGYKKYGDGSTDSGLKAIKNHWQSKISTEGLFVEDGSGLSRTNAISPENFCELLKSMSGSKYSQEFYNSLPVSGESGTLRSLCKNQSGHGKIHAKSGTMNRIKSYSGYIESSSGKTYIFAIIVNNHTCSSSEIKKKMEPLLNAISTY